MMLSQTNAFPHWVVIQLLEKCNLRCKMCYEWGEGGSYLPLDRTHTLGFSVARQVILDCLPVQPYFEFFGGEPLLYPRVGEVIRLIREGGSALEIPTNGLLLEKHAEMLAETQPNRIWVSLDGPEQINDEQRGKGTFRKVLRGIDALYQARQRRGGQHPQVGISFTVTPLNYAFIEPFFFQCLDLSKIDNIIFTFQLFTTEDRFQSHLQTLNEEFSITQAPGTQALVKAPEIFKQMDFAALTRSMVSVRDACEQRGIYFIAYPKTLEEKNIRNYFSGQWDEMTDRRTRCAFPWTYAEVSARGDVSVCHTIYDVPVGNVYQERILDIWRGEALNKLRRHLKTRLFPICPACCRYYYDPDKR